MHCAEGQSRVRIEDIARSGLIAGFNSAMSRSRFVRSVLRLATPAWGTNCSILNSSTTMSQVQRIRNYLATNQVPRCSFSVLNPWEEICLQWNINSSCTYAVFTYHSVAVFRRDLLAGGEELNCEPPAPPAPLSGLKNACKDSV